MYKVVQLNPEIDKTATYWDQTLLHDLLKDYSGVRTVVIIPGAYQADFIDDINMELEQYAKVLVVVTSDEENNFPVSGLYHKDMKVFVNYPNVRQHQNIDGFLPIGYTPQTRELIKQNGISAKSLDWFFAGQISHEERRQCVAQLRGLEGGKLVESPGFAQGLEYPEYMRYICRAKVVPCPAGNVSPDSFRLYETLEAGGIPIVSHPEFWQLLFGEVPFPVLNNWQELPQLIEHYKDRPDVANKCSSWWQYQKRELKWQLNA